MIATVAIYATNGNNERKISIYSSDDDNIISDDSDSDGVISMNCTTNSDKYDFHQIEYELKLNRVLDLNRLLKYEGNSATKVEIRQLYEVAYDGSLDQVIQSSTRFIYKKK